MNKTKKVNNFKKFLLSSFAVFSVAATGGGIISALNTNNQLTNIKQQRNDVSTASVTPPEANDLYNDYSYANGFVTINKAVISFTDWFGFNEWSYDVNANLTTLFGSNSATVASLKVRSSTDGTQIYAYGYLSDSSSYLFKLDASNGSVVSIGNYKAIHGGNLVTNANLLTLINGVAILTQKKPIGDFGTIEQVTIHFSEIDSAGNVTTKDYDISKSTYANSTDANTGLNVASYGYGEIIGVQKEGSNYSFEIKVIVYDDTTTSGRTDTTKARVDVLLINVSNGTYTKGTKVGFWNYTTYSSETVNSNLDLDLDRAAFTLLTTNSNNTLTTYVTAKFDTTTTTIGSSNASGSSAYNATNLIAYSTLTSTTYGYQTLSYSNNQSGSDAIAGTIGFLYDQNANTPYAIVADTNSTSKISIFSLKSSTNPTWIDLSSVVSTNKTQILSVNFIPSSTTQSATTYTGYVEVQQQTDTGSTQLTESKAFFTLNANGTSVSAPNNNVFAFAMSDSQIQSKYQNGVYLANEVTKNQLYNDLIKVNQNGQPYSGVTNTTNNLAINGNTITGNVVLTLKNWWNSGTSQVTRNVNINLASSSKTTNPGGTTPGETSNTNPNNPTPNTTTSSSTNSNDKTLYIVIPIVIIVLLAIALGIFLYVHHKKKSQYKTLKK